MSYAILSVFIIEAALLFAGYTGAPSKLYTAIFNPSGFLTGGFYLGLFLIVSLTATLAVVTPGFIYQVNQWALFAGVSAMLITFVAVVIDLSGFIYTELSGYAPDFALWIAAIITAPVIILYIMATLEWTRFNQ
jgi:hypothetical protein